MRTWHAAAVAVGAAAFTAGGFGIAQAATSIPPNTIHGCVQGTNRTLRQVYVSPSSGTTCSSGFQVIWPSGADNDPAPQAVTAGHGGLDVTFVTAETTNNQTAGGSARVSCPADHPYVISGGGGATNGPVGGNEIADAPLKDSYPLNAGQPASSGAEGGFVTGWYVDYGSSFDGSPVGTVTAFAICAK
jgi:hypothetical protein